MDAKAKRKFGVYTVLTVMFAALIAQMAFYAWAGLPLPLLVGGFVMTTLICALFLYVAKERLDEIEGGQDDDTDNY